MSTEQQENKGSIDMEAEVTKGKLTFYWLIYNMGSSHVNRRARWDVEMGHKIKKSLHVLETQIESLLLLFIDSSRNKNLFFFVNKLE